MRTLRYALWALVAVAGIIFGALLVMPDKTSGPVPGEPFGRSFTLVDHDGEPITQAAFRGHPTAVFFGFTHCPDICPTTLYELNGLIEKLGPQGEGLAAYFVSVDPERDPPELLKQYVTAISGRIVGITGEPADVAAMLEGFHVYARKVPLDGDDYTMDHTASIFLLDSAGAFVGTIGHDEDLDNALAKLKRLVERNPV
jgi:protein SCO1/2